MANFYYLPAGWFAKHIPAVVEAANLGAKLDTLTWSNIITRNWIPSALGNFVGRRAFVATALLVRVRAEGPGRRPRQSWRRRPRTGVIVNREEST